jgi:hypothetical protein
MQLAKKNARRHASWKFPERRNKLVQPHKNPSGSLINN